MPTRPAIEALALASEAVQKFIERHAEEGHRRAGQTWSTSWSDDEPVEQQLLRRALGAVLLAGACCRPAASSCAARTASTTCRSRASTWPSPKPRRWARSSSATCARGDNVRIVADASKAEALFDVLSAKSRGKPILSLNSQGRVREYLLTLHAGVPGARRQRPPAAGADRDHACAAISPSTNRRCWPRNPKKRCCTATCRPTWCSRSCAAWPPIKPGRERRAERSDAAAARRARRPPGQDARAAVRDQPATSICWRWRRPTRSAAPRARRAIPSATC